MQEQKTVGIVVTGLVQGVGFRPFIYRIAIEHGLKGWVINTNESVQIRVTGFRASISQFISDIQTGAPPASFIEEIISSEYPLEHFSGFTIRNSENHSDAVTGISPDLMVCKDCLQDMKKPGPKKDYPFINCTNCGPRFSIIKDVPYDRKQTTMSPFTMCDPCRSEYEDVTDRRFHAQPVACHHCGPSCALLINGREVNGSQAELILKTANIIDEGGIILLKGIGGMHLACDAFQDQAVETLRSIKNREGKPFAVMARDLQTTKALAVVNPVEEQSLLSWKRPVVLLDLRPDPERKPSASVCNGLRQIGIMLPYTPLHYLLFEYLRTDVIVLTSGNKSKEPILIHNESAIQIFGRHVNAMLLHNRDIFNRNDDSVVRVIGGKERVFRRSRGYVPTPVRVRQYVEGIMAYGADLTNSFCLGKGNSAILSQYIGDLEEAATFSFYTKTLERFRQLFRMTPVLAAVDMHPGYYSSVTGMEESSVPVVMVQHHHAHIVACMAEFGLEGNVIGVALDGTGFGDDGTIWGSEFMIAGLKEFQRKYHFDYLSIPGGDRGVEQPWRVAVAWLYKVFGNAFWELPLPFLSKLDKPAVDLIVQMTATKINSPLSCGAGRYFDAVAGLLGICLQATFQAEGPMRLESILDQDCHAAYPFDMGSAISLDPALRAMVNDIVSGTSVGIVAAKFHNTIISVIFDTVTLLRKETGIMTVVLSGGVFQNKYITEQCLELLNQAGFRVYTHEQVPSNDGGIALGQLVIAAANKKDYVFSDTSQGYYR